MPRKEKKRKIRKARKPQPLPRSVQALLGYLTGTDMKLARPGEGRAVIAPSQQQIFQPREPEPKVVIKQYFGREKPVGQTIGASPLAKIIPPKPQIPYQPPPPPQQVIIKETRIEPREEKTSTELISLRSKIEDIGSFQDVIAKKGLELSERVSRINEQSLKQLQRQAPPIKRSQSVVEIKPQEMIEPEQGLEMAREYTENVSRPEMTKATTIRRGRPPMTPEQKQSAKEAREAKKISEGQTAEQALSFITSQVIRKKYAPKTTKSVVRIPSGIDPSSQISSMAAGEAVEQERGQSLESLMGQKQ